MEANQTSIPHHMDYPLHANVGVSDLSMAPPVSMFRSATIGSLAAPLANGNSGSTIYTHSVSNLVDVDRMLRLRHLDDNVYLVSGNGSNHTPTTLSYENSFGNSNSVQHSIVTDPLRVPQSPSAFHQYQGTEDVIPSSIQLVYSLREEVRALQHQMTEIESEFEIRYRRERAMNARLQRIVDRMNVSANFKCHQATQVDISELGRRREQGVQTYDSPLTVQPSGEGRTSHQEELNESDCSSIAPRDDSPERMHSSTPVLVVPDETEELFAGSVTERDVSVTERDVRQFTDSWEDSSTRETEDDQVSYVQPVWQRSGGQSSRKRKRSWVCPQTEGLTMHVPVVSDFPSNHPFRWSSHIALPPKVPFNYCSACYEKKSSRVLAKCCFTCRSLMGCLLEAYMADSDIQLPRCTHLMGRPKRRCQGCIFKVYTYRHNLRYPDKPLPFPIEY